MDRLKRFLFTNQNTKQTVAKNMVWLASGTTLSKVIRSVVIIFAARILGTEGYGAFTYAMSLAALFTIFSDLGLSGILTRALAREEKDRSLIATVTYVKIAFLAIATLLIIFAGTAIAKIGEARSLMPSIALLLAFDSLRSFIYSIARAQSKMQLEAGFEVITEFCITGACIIGLLLHPSAQSLALAYTIGSGFGLILALVGFRKYIRKVMGYFRPSLIRSVLLLSLPFAFIGVFNVLMTNIDSVLIGMWNDAHTLGLFGAAQRPISILYLLPGFLGTSIFPVISKLSPETERGRIGIILEKGILLSLFLALPIVTGGILIASPFINTVFGYDYIGAVSTFKILLLTLLPIFPGIIFYYGIFAQGKQKIFLTSSLCGAVVNIALDLILIPSMGIKGSAIATLFAQLVANAILFREIRKTYSFSIMRKVWKILFATLSMSLSTVLLLSLSAPLLVIIPVAALIYIGVLFALKEKLLLEIRSSLQA